MGFGFIGSEVSASLAPARRRGGRRSRAPACRWRASSATRSGSVLAGDPSRQGGRADHRGFGGRVRRRRPMSSGCAPRRAESSSATWSWPGSASCPTASCWRRPARRSTTACSWTRDCRTSLPDVFAAGDVTNHLHPIFGRLRVEHWNNGYQQGRAAARSLLGRERALRLHPLVLVGSVRARDRVRGLRRRAGTGSCSAAGPDSRKFLGFYLKDGVVRAAVGLDRGGDPEDPKGRQRAEGGRRHGAHRAPRSIPASSPTRASTCAPCPARASA